MGESAADEGVHGENEIGHVTFVCQAFGYFRGSYEAFFFAGGPDERHVTIFQRGAERPHGGNQRGIADAIVEAASIGARAEQRAIGFRNRNGVAEIDAELRDFFGSARADINANGIFRVWCPASVGHLKFAVSQPFGSSTIASRSTFAVCTSAGWPAKKLRSPPPRHSTSRRPSLEMDFTLKPISSMWATTRIRGIFELAGGGAEMED